MGRDGDICASLLTGCEISYISSINRGTICSVGRFFHIEVTKAAVCLLSCGHSVRRMFDRGEDIVSRGKVLLNIAPSSIPCRAGRGRAVTTFIRSEGL